MRTAARVREFVWNACAALPGRRTSITVTRPPGATALRPTATGTTDLLGGRARRELEITSSPAAGTTVRGTVPLAGTAVTDEHEDAR